MAGEEPDTAAAQHEGPDAPASPIPALPGALAAPAFAAAQPAWTYFLTPLAVLIGAVIVAGAIWWVGDDGDGGSSETAPADPNAFTSATGGSASPTTLLSAFTQYATQLSLDTNAFQQCLGDQARAGSISAHLHRGQELGVTGTPTFFINNKMVVGAQPLAIFEEVIERELEGSPTSVEQYSENVRALAATNPPRFAIVEGPPDVSGAYIEGNADAKVMIAEYSDFQCPFCQRWAEQALPTLRQQIGEDVALAFMHFPITQIHANAGYASFAAICAGEQGQFWGMHDILFARQAEWADLPVN